MKYVLENTQEANRLEKQNSQFQYLVREELDYLNLNLYHKKILDAGCGVGTLALELSQIPFTKIDACDFSSTRINQAKLLSLAKNINYFTADLTKMDCPDNHYDVVFIRFVLEHITNPQAINKELKRVLKPGGYLVVIDLDGLIFDLHHQNQVLKDYLFKLKESLPIDLYIGRKLPKMLSELDLAVSELYVQPMVFQGADLEEEIHNMKMRFDQSKTLIEKIIGEENFSDFLNLYLQEMRNARVMVCHKYIVAAQKKAALKIAP